MILTPVDGDEGSKHIQKIKMTFYDNKRFDRDQEI
jgi:hypothetical protein